MKILPAIFGCHELQPLRLQHRPRTTQIQNQKDAHTTCTRLSFGTRTHP